MKHHRNHIDFLTLVDDETRLGALRFKDASGDFNSCVTLSTKFDCRWLRRISIWPSWDAPAV